MDPGRLPDDPSATATIGLSGTYTVTLAATDPAISLATLSITDPNATLTIANAGSVDTLQAASANAGTLTVTNGAILLANGELTNTGSIVVNAGTLELATGLSNGGQISLLDGGVLELLQNGVDITQSDATASLNNSGTLEQLDGGNNYIETLLDNNGLIEGGTGFLELQGGVLGGTIVSGDNLGLIGTYTSTAYTTDTVTFDGATLGWNGDGRAVLQGPGTLASNGYAYIPSYYGDTELQLTGGLTWDNAGTIYQYGTILFGNSGSDTATLVNQAGGIFDLVASGAELLPNGAGTYSFINDGLLEQTGGGTDYIEVPVTNAGTIVAAGGNNLYLTGLVSNTGTIETNGGFLELRGGVLGGTFEANGGNLALTGTYTVASGTVDSVTLAGATFGWDADGPATINGAGTLLTQGNVSIQNYYGSIEALLTGGVTWDNAGTVYQTGTILFGNSGGDTATLVNQAGAIFDLDASGAELLPNGAGTYSFVNAGLLEQTNGGTDYIAVPLTNSGTVLAASGNNLYLTGAVSNTGTIETTGGFVELQGGVLGGTYAAVAGGNLALTGTYTLGTSTIDTINLEDATLGWYNDGAALLDGPGTLVTTGAAYIQDYYSVIETKLTGGITWDNAGTIYQAGTILFGTSGTDSATLVNQAGAIFDLDQSNAELLPNGAGTYSFVNAGLLEQTNGGTDYIAVPLTNAGTVLAASGNNLYLTGAVANTGTIETTGGFVELQGGVLGGTYAAVAGGNLALTGTYTLGTATLDTITWRTPPSAGTTTARPC